jgi:hypothetical protein
VVRRKRETRQEGTLSTLHVSVLRTAHRCLGQLKKNSPIHAGLF